MKKILVTGAKGFVGKNLVAELHNRNLYHSQNHPDSGNLYEVFEYHRNSTEDELRYYTQECDFVFHLAGVNRPKEEKEFITGNFGFTSSLLVLLEEHRNKAPILITSSIQATQDNPYGESKKAGEELIFHYGKDKNVKTFIYRLPNIFGKWCRPNYNSCVATFCYNVANDLEIQVNDSSYAMTLAYIDDVVTEFLNAVDGQANCIGKFCEISTIHKVTLGRIVELLYSFKKSRESLSIPDMSASFTRKLYSTYLSYLPKDAFAYALKMNVDIRGSFTEFIKTANRGQVSVNISKPGITKGNHWHHSKNEKFLVVSGHGVIRFRKVGSDEIMEYFVSGELLKVVDIPPGYTHNIENMGDADMVTVMWVNEVFDPRNPDTYFLEV